LKLQLYSRAFFCHATSTAPSDKSAAAAYLPPRKGHRGMERREE
jgi:hypothetical protein